MGLQCAALFAIFVSLTWRPRASLDAVWFFATIRDILIWAMLVATVLSGLQYLSCSTGAENGHARVSSSFADSEVFG